ncbi:hypothetical protein D3C75_1258790 [compost metagenome]
MVAKTISPPNQATARIARRPVRAASAIEAMPVTSRLNTRGMMVMRRALSHSWPRAWMKSAVA